MHRNARQGGGRVAVVFVVVAAVFAFLSGPVEAGDEVRDLVDGTADVLDEAITGAECVAWSELWPGSAECVFGPEAEFACALSGETVSAEAGDGGLLYTLSGEVECREDGRTVRVLHGTFRTGEGLVTRVCRDGNWCERGISDVYSTTSYRPRCRYEFTGSDGSQPEGASVYERSSAPPDADDRLALRVEVPDLTAAFRADDFSVANGDGLGAHGGVPEAITEFWVLDDGDSANGWAEGVVELRVTMHEHAERLTDGDPLRNCLPVEEFSGFAVEGKIDFELNEESLFRPPPGGE